METTGARKLKLKTQLDPDGEVLALSTKTFMLGGTGPPNVNLGPPIISETTRAKKLNLKIPLHMVNYPFLVQKLLHYTTQHDGSRHIDFWGRL